MKRNKWEKLLILSIVLLLLTACFNKKEDIDKMLQEYKKLGEKKLILTTEKDYVRLMDFEELTDKLFYWPINVEINNKEEFNQIILNYVRENQGNREFH